jgi:hypothetical protein
MRDFEKVVPLGKAKSGPNGAKRVNTIRNSKDI